MRWLHSDRGQGGRLHRSAGTPRSAHIAHTAHVTRLAPTQRSTYRMVICPRMSVTSVSRQSESMMAGGIGPAAPPRTSTFQMPPDMHALTPPYSATRPPPGHMDSIFSLHQNQGNVTEVGPGDYPDGATFFSVHAPTTDAQRRGPTCQDAIERGDETMPWRWRVCGDPGWGEPLVLREYAKQTSPRAFERLASDEAMKSAYLRRDDFSPPPRLQAVELGPRRETRRLMSSEMPLSTFLRSYQAPQQRPEGSPSSEEHVLYAVSPLPHRISADVNLPDFLRCGGAARLVHSHMLWMSAGGTESVLHTDQYDNLNCVYAGTKRFWLVDSVFHPYFADPRCGWYDADHAAKAAGDGAMSAEARRLQHGYGTFGGRINVSAVDVTRFPCLANMPFREATLRPGDCLFIPRHWYHHVASDGDEARRSVALNLWWRRPEQYVSNDCVESSGAPRGGGGGKATASRLYADDEPVPIADCAMSILGDEDAGHPTKPPCVPGRRGDEADKEEL